MKYYIFVSVSEFLANGGELEPHRSLYSGDRKLIGIVPSKPNKVEEGCIEIFDVLLERFQIKTNIVFVCIDVIPIWK